MAHTLAVSTAFATPVWLIADLAHIPLTDAYLATAPGDINAVLATGVSTHADVSLTSSAQSLRLFAMVVLLIRLAAFKDGASSTVAARAWTSSAAGHARSGHRHGRVGRGGRR
ncbi:hypothetical protein DDE74_36715 [Streptomyces lydicus]|uniref:Uncharacterized protein n=2 Tax=Streptomyces lydicus TaxID=47763 RepID=A0A3S9YKV5_9ACTN|nr:hypothetical protein DDE74_36715 [Streptomyces lydicus]